MLRVSPSKGDEPKHGGCQTAVNKSTRGVTNTFVFILAVQTETKTNY